MKKKKFVKVALSLFLISTLLLSSVGCTDVIETPQKESNRETSTDTIESITEDSEKNIESNTESNTESSTESNIESSTESNIESSTESNTESNIESDTESNTKNPTGVHNHIGKDYDGIRDYKIVKVDDDYRFVFDDTTVYENSYASLGLPGFVGFEVDSIENFLADMVAGTLSFLDKRLIFGTWDSEDEKGLILCDPYNVYKPTHPISHETLYTRHEGRNYSYHLKFEEPYNYSPTVIVLSKHSYDIGYTAFASIDSQEKNIEYEKELSNGSVMLCYNKTVETDRYSTKVKYVLSDGTKTVFVAKTYDDIEKSTIPKQIDLLGVIGGDKYFSVCDIYKPIQDLSDEFLFGFGIELVESFE